MAEKQDVIQLIYEALESLNAELAADKKVALSPDTSLFGPDAALDSLSLVSVIVDVEALIQDNYGRTVSLADDRAISQPVSPFASVEALANYVMLLLSEPG